MKNINHVAIVLNQPIEKSETFIQELVKGLKRKDYNRFHFFVLNKKLTISKITALLKSIVFLSKWYRFLIDNRQEGFFDKFKYAYVNAELLSSRINFQVVHYTFSNLVHNPKAIQWALNAKISIGFRGYDISYYPLNYPNFYSSNYWDGIDSIQTNSDDLYDWAKRWGVPKNIPATKITASVNNDNIVSSTENREYNNSSLINIGFVGRLHWKKGLDILIQVILHFKDENFHWHIVGDGPEMEKLRFILFTENLGKKVKLHGKLSGGNLVTVVDQFDLLIAPSIQEGCSNVVLEAQARGKYCVVSDAEGMYEVIENLKTGKVCPKYDIQAYISAITEYVNLDVKSRNAMSDYAILRIKQNFSRQKQINEWVSYFDQLCLNS
jgi:colanic acid/amylovoran biosynthesis glycosyltransferase